MNFNRVDLAGRLTRDPELRYTPSNTPVVTFGLATDTVMGKGKKETTFVDVEMFGKVAEVVNQHFNKGKQIFITGRLRLDQWEKDGQKRSKLKVLGNTFEFVDPPSKNKPNNDHPQDSYDPNRVPVVEDDIPF